MGDEQDTQSAEQLEEGHVESKPSGRRPRLRLVRRLVLAIAVLLCIALVVSCFITVPFEAITPGSTLNVGSLITTPKADRHRSAGSVSLVDVDLVSLRAISYVIDRLNHNDDVVPNDEILGTESQAAYDEQGVLDMASAQQAATYVAFHQLGWPVKVKTDGVVVYATLPNSPAAHGAGGGPLSAGDVLTSIGGVRASSYETVERAITSRHPGDRLSLTVKTFDTASVHSLSIELGELLDTKDGGQECKVVSAPSAASAKRTACVGVELEQLYTTTHQPFPVNLSAEGIIGPSAGLSFTLGLMKALDSGDLTGGTKIAATGTMSLDGAIGDVGGVAQKTIAVRASGASVFFVPKVEFKVAKAEAGPRLRIFPVTTISEVLHDLEGLGGQVVKEYGR